MIRAPPCLAPPLHDVSKARVVATGVSHIRVAGVAGLPVMRWLCVTHVPHVVVASWPGMWTVRGSGQGRGPRAARGHQLVQQMRGLGLRNEAGRPGRLVTMRWCLCSALHDRGGSGGQGSTALPVGAGWSAAAAMGAAVVT